jgi:hypothetical protein
MKMKPRRETVSCRNVIIRDAVGHLCGWMAERAAAAPHPDTIRRLGRLTHM